MELVHGEELFEKIVGKGFYSEKDAAQCVGDILKALQVFLINKQTTIEFIV